MVALAVCVVEIGAVHLLHDDPHQIAREADERAIERGKEIDRFRDSFDPRNLRPVRPPECPSPWRPEFYEQYCRR